jgi:hypothetical protein
MPIGALSSALVLAQAPQQIAVALQAIASTQSSELAVSNALLGGSNASANPNLGQLVNLSV